MAGKEGLAMRFPCPVCNKLLSAPAGAAGRLVPCPSCHGGITVPDIRPTELEVPLPVEAPARRQRTPPAPLPRRFPWPLALTIAGGSLAVLLVMIGAGVALVQTAVPMPDRPAPYSAALQAEDGWNAPGLRSFDPNPILGGPMNELRPRDYSFLPAEEQAKLLDRYERAYLDPQASDADLMKAVGILLGLPAGPKTLVKALDHFAAGEGQRYRWSLQYALEAQGYEGASAIPTEHLAALLDMVKAADSTNKVRLLRELLRYLKDNPEKGAAMVPTFVTLRDRMVTKNDSLAESLQDVIDAITGPRP